jgi:hypothetical protein
MSIPVASALWGRPRDRWSSGGPAEETHLARPVVDAGKPEPQTSDFCTPPVRSFGCGSVVTSVRLEVCNNQTFSALPCAIRHVFRTAEAAVVRAAHWELFLRWPSAAPAVSLHLTHGRAHCAGPRNVVPSGRRLPHFLRRPMKRPWRFRLEKTPWSDRQVSFPLELGYTSFCPLYTAPLRPANGERHRVAGVRPCLIT